MSAIVLPDRVAHETDRPALEDLKNTDPSSHKRQPHAHHIHVRRLPCGTKPTANANESGVTPMNMRGSARGDAEQQASHPLR